MNLMLAVIYALFELMGIVSAVHAVLRGRTPQGTTAWVLGLVVLPALSVPIYWIFGRSKFNGYVHAWRDQSLDIEEELDTVYAGIQPFLVSVPVDFPEYKAVRRISHSRFLRGNRVELLVDGQATYDSLYRGIESAQHYVLFQFYILRADDSGNRFRDLLVAKAQQGVAVYVLYDELGSAGLPWAWLAQFGDAGIRIVPFNTQRGIQNRFQLNFRNHRKNVVIDGAQCWMGGLNIGDDYLGEDKKLCPWRDTHLRVEGPAALVAQTLFWSDWYWADQSLIRDLCWEPRAAPPDEGAGQTDRRVLVFGSGPADSLETASLFYTTAMSAADRRIWIATPYFVPDEATMAALRVAVLKGIDVRLITPSLNDNWFVRHAANVYLSELSMLGARIYFFDAGFMHQKVMLVDEELSVVGSANFDNRSFRLNFEISAVVSDREFAAELEAMLLRDLAHSTEIVAFDLDAQSLWQRIKARGSDLLAPVL